MHLLAYLLARMRSVTRFGAYRFDPLTAQLWDEAREVRLTPKAAAVLVELVSKAGTVVTKEHLFATVWRDTVVSDDALTSCIKELRRAFADDPKHPRFIETRHRRGFRFVALVDTSVPASQDPGARASGATTAPAVEDSRSAQISAIAVLPFADMSPHRDQDYLCKGIAEELINALTHVEHLRVVSRMASFQFRSVGADLRAVGEQLGVGALLEGSVRKQTIACASLSSASRLRRVITAGPSDSTGV